MIYGLVPANLTSCLTVCTPVRAGLRSASDVTHLVVHKIHNRTLKSAANRSFYHSVPRLRNALPQSIRCGSTAQVFKRLWKTASFPNSSSHASVWSYLFVCLFFCFCFSTLVWCIFLCNFEYLCHFHHVVILYLYKSTMYYVCTMLFYVKCVFLWPWTYLMLNIPNRSSCINYWLHCKKRV